MGDHVKMMDMLSKLGTEGFAAIIREHDGKNNGPLHYAALNNDVLMTKLLIQYGAGIYMSCDFPIDFFIMIDIIMIQVRAFLKCGRGGTRILTKATRADERD